MRFFFCVLTGKCFQQTLRSPSIHGELHGESHPESRHQQSLPFQPIPSTAFDSVELHEQKGEENDMLVCPPLTTHSSFFTVKLL